MTGVSGMPTTSAQPQIAIVGVGQTAPVGDQKKASGALRSKPSSSRSKTRRPRVDGHRCGSGRRRYHAQQRSARVYRRAVRHRAGFRWRRVVWWSRHRLRAGAGSAGDRIRQGLDRVVLFRRRLGIAPEGPYGFHDMYPAKMAFEKHGVTCSASRAWFA